MSPPSGRPNDEIIHAFCSELLSEGKSLSTVQNYRATVTELMNWLHAKGAAPLERLNTEAKQLRYYRSHLMKSFEAPTVNRKLTAVRRFFRWGADRGLIKPIEAKLKTVPLTEKKDRGPGLSAEEQNTLLEFMKSGGFDRDAALIVLILELGFRVSEICDLTWRDVHLFEPRNRLTFTLPRPGKRPQLITIAPQRAKWQTMDGLVSRSDDRVRRRIPYRQQVRLYSYIIENRSSIATDEPVFMFADRRITRRAIEHIISDYTRAARVPTTANVLRETFLANRQSRIADVEQEVDERFEAANDNLLHHYRSDIQLQLAGFPLWERIGSLEDTFQDMFLTENVRRETTDLFVLVLSYELRDHAIRLAVLMRANGCCERCGYVAISPFFLETHHIFAAEDRKDRYNNCASLCPNCHREAHLVSKREAIERELLRFLSKFPPVPPDASQQ